MSRRSVRVAKVAWERFLEVLAEGATITEAAERAGVSRQQAYRKRQKDEAFALAWADAWERGTDRIEAVHRELAIEREDLHALRAILAARRPQEWSERYRIEVAGRVDHRVTHTLELDAMRKAAAIDPEAAERMAAALALASRVGERVALEAGGASEVVDGEAVELEGVVVGLK
jgi:hypothetical protein